MNHIQYLTKEEIHYICNEMPLERIKTYFKRAPKEFSKIRPGFRPDKINRETAVKLLEDNIKNDFITSFINGTIDTWIKSINEELNKHDEECVTKYVNVLKDSYFANNVDLFFKLNNNEQDKINIEVVQASINVVLNIIKSKTDNIDITKEEFNNLHNKLESVNKELRKKDREAKTIEKELSIKSKECIKVNDLLKKTREENDELFGFKKKYLNADKQRKELEEKLKKTAESLKKEKDQSTLYLREIDDLKKEIIKNQNKYMIKQNRPIKPIKYKEFVLDFEENIYSYGIDDDSNSVALLSNYLCKLLFSGTPILVSRFYSEVLVNCINNSLLGNHRKKILQYSKDVTINDVEKYFYNSDRLIVLDGFIGNYNEMELIDLFRNNKDKIIVLSCAYERSLKYVSDEFLKYCHYINFSHIPVNPNNKYKVEPSEHEEKEEDINVSIDSSESKRLTRIMEELHFSSDVIKKQTYLIESNDDFVSSLLFFVVPYCKDVMNIDPFKESDTLARFVEKTKYKAEFEVLIDE